MNSQVKRKLAEYDQVQPNLITLQCMICFIEFDDDSHKPILICTNQHNMCKTCVQKKLFKIEIKKKGEFDNYDNVCLCPLCNQEVNQKNLRQNNLLLEVYKWIRQISQRQKQRISLIKDDMEDLKTQTQATKKVLQKVYEENVYLHQILDTINQQKNIEIQMKSIQNINLSKVKQQQKEKHADRDHDLVLTKEKLIQKYQSILTKLKSEKNTKLQKQKKKQKQNGLERKIIFLIDKTHDHFSKFKISKQGIITMQGPFYRSFFQDFNYFYNLVSKDSIHYIHKSSQIKNFTNVKICFQLYIIDSKKGRIFVGFGNQKLSKEVNSHLMKQYFGFNIQTGDFIVYGETIKSKLHSYKAEAASIYEFQLQYININNVNNGQSFNKFFFTVSQKQKENNNHNKKSLKIQIQIQKKNQNQLIFPIVSMQVVGDSIKITSLSS